MSSSESSLYFRQLLVGRDLAVDNGFGRAMRNYIYVIGDRSTGEALIVDPAYAPAEILGALENEGLHLVGVIATHYHADHVGGSIAGHDISGLPQLLQHVDVPVHVQRDEARWITEALDVPPSSLVSHASGDLVPVGGITVELIHTPGHTPGSQCIHVRDVLLTGDTLFIDGCGRTDLPGGDPAALYDSLHVRLSSIPQQTMVFPGHAYSPLASASIEELRNTNPVLIDIARQEWIARFT